MIPKGLKLPPLRIPDRQFVSRLSSQSREELQSLSHAAFTWRTLETLRDIWKLALPGGRVELVIFDHKNCCGYVLDRPDIETLPFPWPSNRTAFYFYLPHCMWPVPVSTDDPRRALGEDGVSVRTEWVLQVIEGVLEVFGKASTQVS
jgi:hypothetical protein